jgi:hypothetical protein
LLDGAFRFTTQVCRSLRDFVRAHVYLQYLLELDNCGYVEPLHPRTDLDYTEKIELLRSHRTRWNDPSSITPDLHELPFRESLPVYSLTKGVFSWGHRDEATYFISQIYFLQLPSKNRGTDSKHWSISDLPLNVRYFWIDPEQDLLILLDISGGVHTTHVRSMMSNQAHPKVAPGRSVLVHKYGPDNLNPDRVYFFGAYDHSMSVASYLRSDGSNYFHVAIWDWTTGEQLSVSLFLQFSKALS